MKHKNVINIYLYLYIFLKKTVCWNLKKCCFYLFRFLDYQMKLWSINKLKQGLWCTIWLSYIIYPSIYLSISIYLYTSIYLYFSLYIYIDGIHYWRILRSSYRKLTGVGFEPTTNEIHSEALTNWAMRPWVQLTLRENFLQLL